MKLPKRQMYQCHVTERGDNGTERQIPVGPRADRQDVAAGLCEAINKAVAQGKERRWHDARVIQVDEVHT